MTELKTIKSVRVNQSVVKIYYRDNNKYIGELYKEVDGFFVYEPTSGGGYWTEHVMRDIADKLEYLNRHMYEEMINQI